MKPLHIVMLALTLLHTRSLTAIDESHQLNGKRLSIFGSAYLQKTTWAQVLGSRIKSVHYPSLGFFYEQIAPKSLYQGVLLDWMFVNARDKSTRYPKSPIYRVEAYLGYTFMTEKETRIAFYLGLGKNQNVMKHRNMPKLWFINFDKSLYLMRQWWYSIGGLYAEWRLSKRCTFGVRTQIMPMLGQAKGRIFLEDQDDHEDIHELIGTSCGTKKVCNFSFDFPLTYYLKPKSAVKVSPFMMTFASKKLLFGEKVLAKTYVGFYSLGLRLEFLREF